MIFRKADTTTVPGLDGVRVADNPHTVTDDKQVEKEAQAIVRQTTINGDPICIDTARSLARAGVTAPKQHRKDTP